MVAVSLGILQHREEEVEMIGYDGKKKKKGRVDDSVVQLVTF